MMNEKIEKILNESNELLVNSCLDYKGNLYRIGIFCELYEELREKIKCSHLKFGCCCYDGIVEGVKSENND